MMGLWTLPTILLLKIDISACGRCFGINPTSLLQIFTLFVDLSDCVEAAASASALYFLPIQVKFNYPYNFDGKRNS